MSPREVKAMNQPTKEIKRVGSEYDVFVDGEYVGSRKTRDAAQTLADETVYRLLGGK